MISFRAKAILKNLQLDFFLAFAYNKTKGNDMATRRKKPEIEPTLEDLQSPALQEVLSGVEDELLVIGSDYRIRFANLAAQRKLDQESALVGKPCYRALQGRDKPCIPTGEDCRVYLCPGGLDNKACRQVPIPGLIFAVPPDWQTLSGNHYQ